MGKVSVWLLTEPEPRVMECPAKHTAEELCLAVCKSSGIAPLTRTLFALRKKGTQHYILDNADVNSAATEYELRIRFKMTRIKHLKRLDENAFNYFFEQVRNDVINNQIPEITYEKYKKELLGLGIIDMYREILAGVAQTEVERNYKSYIPREILHKHKIFAKKSARKYLQQVITHYKGSTDANYMKEQYLQQVQAMAPNYLSETYHCRLETNRNDWDKVVLQLAPSHGDQPGLRYTSALGYNADLPPDKWRHACTMEQLVYLIRKSERRLELFRKEGAVLWLHFPSPQHMDTFISGCDGYYRLMVKSTFNLSKDDPTPSLQILYENRCHGPVGGEFSFRKLEEKRGRRHGSYILRQCQFDYDVYYLDVCGAHGSISTHKVEFKGTYYQLAGAGVGAGGAGAEGGRHAGLRELTRAHRDPAAPLYLAECLPPSEYDKSQMLLCGGGEAGEAGQARGAVTVGDATLVEDALAAKPAPRLILNKELRIFSESRKLGSNGVTITYKGKWMLEGSKRVEVMLKTIVPDKLDDYIKEFFDMANWWSSVKSRCIVKLYGITLVSPTAMVMEHLPLGPLDAFLRARGEKVTTLQMMKACSQLAMALLELSEAGCVHGYVRCKKLSLAHCDAERIAVKLRDPGLHAYTAQDCHWIPVELFGDMSAARACPSADVWAFATVVWEIFSYGRSPNDENPKLTTRSYERGFRLGRPGGGGAGGRCSAAVWQVVSRCWSEEPARRPSPQILMRDITYILYQDYECCNSGGYETVSEASSCGGTAPPSPAPTLHLDTWPSMENGFGRSMVSRGGGGGGGGGGTGTASATDATSQQSAETELSSFSNTSATFNVAETCLDSLCLEEGPGQAGAYGAGVPVTPIHYCNSIHDMGKYEVTLLAPIGSGFFGEVYRGVLERKDGGAAPVTVAVKTIRRRRGRSDADTDSTGAGERESLAQLRKEIDIMKNLQHPNIVNIEAVSDQPDNVLIVMEYMEMGSLARHLRHHRDRLDPLSLLKYCLDIAQGMEHLSAKRIVHRDLAARNILVADMRTVKISDFGLARFTGAEDAYRFQTRDLCLPMKWYAPESRQLSLFSSASDVWSYGVTCWEIFTYGQEVPPVHEQDRHPEPHHCFSIPEQCPTLVHRDLLLPCWAAQPPRRPRFIDLVRVCNKLLRDLT